MSARVLFLLTFLWGTLSPYPLHSQPSKGLRVVSIHQLLPPAEARTRGHPKLVALLVGEDYSREAGRPEWGPLGELPGVWQDLGRMKRRLEALGFGKIIVLASNQKPGSHKEVRVRALSGISGEPEAGVHLTFNGPATRAAMVEAADDLKAHLNRYRTAGDGQGNEVPPLFLFYYSGHGFVSAQRGHSLPLADNLSGEPTGALIELIAGTVGADDPARGAAGGGSSLIFLDCCQAGDVGMPSGSRGGGGLLEATLMDAIRAGRKGRFLVGASLGDERAREGPAGGYFTGALCAALSPQQLGKAWKTERTLSLNHLVLEVDRMLLETGKQAVSRFPSPGTVSWDNYVLFPNPHYEGVREPLRLFVTVPAGVRVQGEEEGVFRDLELLKGGFVEDEALRRQERRVYVVPEEWRGRRLRLRAVPETARDRVRFAPSRVVEIPLVDDPGGAPLMVALTLREVPAAGGPSQALNLQRMQELYVSANAAQDPLEGYRLLQAALDLRNRVSPQFRVAADALGQDIEQRLGRLRPRAGKAQLERLVRRILALVKQNRYREAYDRLEDLASDAPDLREFGLRVDEVKGEILKAREKVLKEWSAWAERRRREEADLRMAQAERFLQAGQPWQSWRRAFEAGVLEGESSRIRGMSQKAQDVTIESFLDSRVSLDVLVSNGAYGILAGLIRDPGPFGRRLRQVLETRYRLTADSLKVRMALDQERFREIHPEWFPPSSPVPGLGGPMTNSIGMEFVLIPAGEFMMGSTNGDSDEQPVHRVVISRPFYMGKYEVTQGAFEQFVRATGYRTTAEKEGWSWVWKGSKWKKKKGANWRNTFSGTNRPVVCVSWDDAVAFCQWLTNKERQTGQLPEGQIYRLPTEAEWEYACRAGSRGDYAGELDAMGWYSSNSGGKTHPVGQKQPNAWGLYDMHGNVWEWVQDWYGSYPSGTVTDPTGPSSGSLRVNRGGSWFYNARRCRSAHRHNNLSPSSRGYDLGFRLVRRAE